MTFLHRFRKSCHLALISILLLMSPYLYSAYTGGIVGTQQKYSIDAKIEGKADADEALSDDVSSIYYNPAGLSHIKKHMILGSYLPYWDSLTSMFFIGISIKTKYLPLVIGVLNIIADGIKLRQQSTEVTGITKYQSTSIFVASGCRIIGELSIGLRINVIYENILDYEDIGTGVDFALLWRAENPYFYTENKFLKIIRPISLGITIYNLLAPEIKLKQTREKFPLMLKCGLSYRTKKIRNSLNIEPIIGLEAIPDYDILKFNAGIELGFWKMVYVRGGYKITEDNFTIGAGFDLKNTTVDYGMTFLPIRKNLYTFNIKIRF